MLLFVQFGLIIDLISFFLYLFPKQENQIVLLLNESESNSDTSERSLMVMIQASDLPFISVPLCMSDNIFFLHQLEVRFENYLKPP